MDQVQLGHNKGSPPAIHNGDLLKVLTSYYLLNRLSCELWIDPIHAPKVHVVLTSTHLGLFTSYYTLVWPHSFNYIWLYVCLIKYFKFSPVKSSSMFCYKKRKKRMEYLFTRCHVIKVRLSWLKINLQTNSDMHKSYMKLKSYIK